MPILKASDLSFHIYRAIGKNYRRRGIKKDFNIDSHKQALANLVIYDAQGKQVHQLSLNLEMGVNKYRLQEMANWPAGLYWYRVDTEEGRLSGRVVKQ